MSTKHITIKGAREHNLKSINLDIPRDKFVVITGLSGSGKSSLAFDTIYAEGQRRYVESLSAYARQFLERMKKPDVDSISGLSPAISIEQKTVSKNPRSTVGTVTEIYDYLRLLFARVGKPFCYNCQKPISFQTVQQMVDQILKLPVGSKLNVLAPLVKGRKGEYHKEFEQLRREGYIRVNVDGKILDLSDDIKLDKNKKHFIDVYVDKLVLKVGAKNRITDSLENTLKLGHGLAKVEVTDDKKSKEIIFSENFACIDCGISYPEITPQMFSFNSPQGACPECAGLGNKMYFDPKLVVPDHTKTLNDGALHPWGSRSDNYYFQMLKSIASHYGFKMDVPFNKLPENVKQIIFYGSNGEVIDFSLKGDFASHSFRKEFEGIIGNLERRYRETESDYIRDEISRYMTYSPCPTCKGARLKKESLHIKVGNFAINQVCALSIKESFEFFSTLKLTKKDEQIASRILKEIKNRLEFLENVGLNYLSLDRTSSTLAGGEGQRIRLATQIGSSLVGVVYILDEPSIGLHQRDNNKLIETLMGLRNLGNTVLVVEHDASTILSADHVIDLGPGAGKTGGHVVCEGSPKEIMECENSLTGKYLSGKLEISIPKKRKKPNKKCLKLQKSSGNNLKEVDVSFPLGIFTCVTGVSGSGKSTLVIDTLYKALAKKLYKASESPMPFDKILGLEFIDKVIDVDQSPIGRTPRSNPATYTGVFGYIREVFAEVPESKMRGYKIGRYSFNVKGGRCEACQGDGIIKIEMHFLPDIYVECEMCQGKRYNRETLEIKYKGKNIYDVLEMTVNEAYVFFKNIPRIRNKIETLRDVGLGYIHLGQAATTLSGGEAQRIKLAKELSKRSTGRTIYILDEPTTGLHFDDIKKLLEVLNRLIEGGNTVIVIEHNLDVIKCADHVIDLGPEGGDEGGYVVAEGTPEEVVRNRKSYTGKYLKTVL